MPDIPPPDAAPAGPAGANGRPVRRRPVAVLFGYHSTLACVEDPVSWVLAAAAGLGVTLPRPRATVLADRLVMAGRPGGPAPARVPPQLAEVWAERHLYPYAHRAAYTGLARTVDPGIPELADGLADALYERLFLADAWRLYPDALPTLSSLQAAGVPVGIVGNVGFDPRPVATALGLARLVDVWVLSYEVGRCKPDPAIFLHGCTALGAEPERVLVVGDSPADAAAAAVGCTALIVPAGPVEEPNGLTAALDLVGCDLAHT